MAVASTKEFITNYLSYASIEPQSSQQPICEDGVVINNLISCFHICLSYSRIFQCPDFDNATPKQAHLWDEKFITYTSFVFSKQIYNSILGEFY